MPTRLAASSCAASENGSRGTAWSRIFHSSSAIFAALLVLVVAQVEVGAVGLLQPDGDVFEDVLKVLDQLIAGQVARRDRRGAPILVRRLLLM